jgi:ABC-type anion transport system duplicated permease subunit
MKLLKDLFSTDYGLMSLGVIVFTILMGVYFSRLFKRKMDESAKQAGK